MSSLGDQRADFGIGWSGNVDVDLFEVELRFAFGSNLLCFGLNPFEQHIDLRRIEITKLETKHDLSGNTVRRAGQRVDSADRADLPSGHARHHALHTFDKLRRRE